MKKIWCLALALLCGAASAQYFDRDFATCESWDFKYNTCRVDSDVYDVRLYRQISESNCSEGSSWGFSRGYIWVDHGCRAEFELIKRGGGGGGGWDPGYTDVTCESDDQRFQRCFVHANSIRDVDILVKHSKASCDYGYSWGYDHNSVWVDRGCRATFRVRTSRR
jgi:hypothetical protein